MPTPPTCCATSSVGSATRPPTCSGRRCSSRGGGESSCHRTQSRTWLFGIARMTLRGTAATSATLRLTARFDGPARRGPTITRRSTCGRRSPRSPRSRPNSSPGPLGGLHPRRCRPGHGAQCIDGTGPVPEGPRGTRTTADRRRRARLDRRIGRSRALAGVECRMRAPFGTQLLWRRHRHPQIGHRAGPSPLGFWSDARMSRRSTRADGEPALATYLRHNAHAFTRAHLVARWSRHQLDQALSIGAAVRLVPGIYAYADHRRDAVVMGEAVNFGLREAWSRGAWRFTSTPLACIAGGGRCGGARWRPHGRALVGQSPPDGSLVSERSAPCRPLHHAGTGAGGRWRYALPRDRRNLVYEALWARVCTWRQVHREAQRTARLADRRDLERVLGWFAGGATSPLEVRAQTRDVRRCTISRVRVASRPTAGFPTRHRGHAASRARWWSWNSMASATTRAGATAGRPPPRRRPRGGGLCHGAFRVGRRR